VREMLLCRAKEKTHIYRRKKKSSFVSRTSSCSQGCCREEGGTFLESAKEIQIRSEHIRG